MCLEMVPGFKANLYFCFRACATHPKVASVKLRYKSFCNLGKIKKAEFVCVFMNALLIVMTFRSEYHRAVMVGMYAVTLAYDNVLSN